MTALTDEEMPDFSKAVTRPVGKGNLHVVRQELVGYQPGDISHIENVCEGELKRRSTRREEFSETILAEETITTQAEERDLQSTDRSELASETQKEFGSSTSHERMVASDYGRLVESKKTNFARDVVSKSVESLTQEVRRQRVQRERRSFVERVQHVVDNSKGTEKIRGIYQWVDKRYSLRLLDYGKRWMYDVVVPEPSAFLIEALKNAVQPERFQLTKPLKPKNPDPEVEEDLMPDHLDIGNYDWFATQYGVTGSVTPPPEIYRRTVAHVVPLVDVSRSVVGAFTLNVPEGYRATNAYVQMAGTVIKEGVKPEWVLAVSIGLSTATVLAEHHWLNMNDETGDIPVGYCFNNEANIVSSSFAVALLCWRTDDAYAQWQLKTHAAIVSGYKRQLADYEDRLSRYVAAVRTQLASAGNLAGNFAHDPTLIREELKRAFIFLLLGEHPATWVFTPVPSIHVLPPWVTLPDPVEVKEWGAVVAFFERAFEWENLMYTFYPYYWGDQQRWWERLLTQDADPQFEAFLKAGAARIVVPVRPGFAKALAHYHETGDVWMGEEIPDMFGDNYVSIIDEIKAANFAAGSEVCLEQWEVTLPTTLVMLKDDATLPTWTPTPCIPPVEP